MSRDFGPTATVSSKGQIAIPLRFRRALGWRPGDVLALEPRGDGVALRRVDPILGWAIRERQRTRRTLADDEVLLLALLDDPATPDEALHAQVRRIRRRVRGGVAGR